jgi:6-phosphogluconolactonase
VAAPAGLLYVGTYTRHGRSEGIQVFSVDPRTGALEHRGAQPEVDPSFLAFSPDRDVLFATSEGLTSDTAALASFGVDPDNGRLSPVNRQPTGGGEPCHLVVAASGRFVIVANHENGTVAVFPADASGRLAPASEVRQHVGSAPHAHHAAFDPTGRHVLVTDKGIDQVVVYTLDVSQGRLVPNVPPFGRIHAGAAPRHLAFGRGGGMVYVNGEADMTLAACTYDAISGELEEVQMVSTLPEGERSSGWSTAEVEVAPSGEFVYVSNRGHDTIASFRIDSQSGRLTPLGHVSSGGKTPRHFAIHPSGQWLYVANQDSDTIVQFDLDAGTGRLRPTGREASVGAPVCLLFS